MPSAARQRLQTELWKNPEPTVKSSVPSTSSVNYDILAHPGSLELPGHKAVFVSRNFQQQQYKKQHTPTKKTSKKHVQKRGSSADIFREEADSGGENQQAVNGSAYSDSECGVSYNTVECSDFFAVDSVKAPAVNRLPLPPPEWLKTLSIKNIKISAKSDSPFQFQAFLDTMVAAERLA